MTEHLNAEEIKAFQALLSKDEGRSEMVQLFKCLGMQQDSILLRY